MQAQDSIFQATIAIRLVTTSNHVRGNDPDPGSGSLLKVTVQIRITKVTV